MKIDLPPLSSRPEWIHPVSAPLIHRYFEDTVRRLHLMIDLYRIVFLVGPTGIGKSAVAEYLVAHYNEEVAYDPQFLRAAMVDARTRRERAYSIKEFWSNVLTAVGDPLPGRKVVRPDPSSANPGGRLPRPHGPSQDQLFGMVRKAACDRGLRVLFVDEAVALFLHLSRDHLERMLDILRDLNKGLNFTIVLVATGRLLAALRGLPDLPDDLRHAPHAVSSAELGRRRNYVYFPHYRPDVLEEHQHYGRAVRTLFDRLPPELRPKLRPAHHTELIARTNGCVGETIEWFVRAVKVARQLGDARLRWDHFEADAAIPDPDRDAARAQAEMGVELYEEVTRKTFDPRIESSAPAAQAESAPPLPPSPSPPAKRKSRTCQRVGKPGPKRHSTA